jgi:glycosyltransferase involved in cell wall biosynthesis
MLPRSLRHRRLRVVASGIDVVARRAKILPIDRRRARVSVVMPVFNEKQTFAEVIGGLIVKQVANLDLEIVIVESNSTDGTREDVRQLEGHPRVTVIWQERPRGKGNAVRAGLSRVTGDFVLIQDADLEYDLDDYEMLLEPLRTFRRAFVLGIRHGRDGHSWKMRHFTDQVLLGRWMNLGHLIFTGLFNIVYGQRLRDPFTMFKVFRRECLSGLQFECNAFDFDWELAGKLVRCGYEPLEIPVNYKSRSFAEGKKVTMIRDPLTWLRACFKYRFSPLKDDRPDNRPDDLT